MNVLRLIAFFLALAVAGLLTGLGVFEPLDMMILDRQFTFLRQERTQPLPDDVVLVGIDEILLDGMNRSHFGIRISVSSCALWRLLAQVCWESTLRFLNAPTIS